MEPPSAREPKPDHPNTNAKEKPYGILHNCKLLHALLCNCPGNLTLFWTLLFLKSVIIDRVTGFISLGWRWFHVPSTLFLTVFSSMIRVKHLHEGFPEIVVPPVV